MNYKIIKAKPNTAEKKPINFDHIPFTKEELFKAHLVKHLRDNKMYMITQFVGDNLIEIAPITQSGLPHKRMRKTVYYWEIIELHILES